MTFLNNKTFIIFILGTYTKTSNGSKFTGKLDVRKYREV